MSDIIQNNRYFLEVRSWYSDKYLYPYTHFIYVLIIAVATVIGSIIIVGVAALKYTTQRYIFPIYVEDQVKYFTMIKELTVGYEPINISVARYFITKYVIAHEEYNHAVIIHNGWQETVNKIKASSSRRVFDQYIRYNDLKHNPNSPLLLYKLQADRLIEVLAVTFPPDTSRPSEATVRFRATVKGQEKVSSNIWEASLSFNMTDIERIVHDEVPLSFLVTNYSVKLIRNE